MRAVSQELYNLICWECPHRKMTEGNPIDCRAGDEALARGAWNDARLAYEAALANRESAEALEGLGTSAWWLDLARSSSTRESARIDFI